VESNAASIIRELEKIILKGEPEKAVNPFTVTVIG
jgi:hypothetical protein